MRKPAVVVAVLVCLGTLGGGAFAVAAQDASGQDDSRRSIVITNDDGGLATVALPGDTFAVSYRNSLYGTLAEERYTVLPDGSFRLDQIAADQLAVLEEYYGVPGAPTPADPTDRRKYVVDPDPEHPAVFNDLSIAATDLGERTLHLPGAAPVSLWSLVDDDQPFILLDIKETP
ncbi:hypothetical protein IWX64_000520 [Arthrobacter sp. CAN_A212]|uniref:hypothetical protein n=1 Tax=unclassified Arthrobacter TaxID=235627 RepID=UPI0018CAA744|nr:hypothetical protein [Arthrobacter sp. CAN_C5]MBP2215297.1 hypothetical protein [Arthrobacter sp. CAN_C5]